MDFSHKDLVNNRESRGPKNAGTLKVDSKSNDIECEREKSAFLVIYNDESEIPWTPSEKDAVNDSASAELSMPKLIPLPFELRVSPHSTWSCSRTNHSERLARATSSG